MSHRHAISAAILPTELTKFFSEHTRMASCQEWLMQVLRPHCRNEKRGWPGGTLNAMQEPYELAAFLIFLKQRQVKTYVELGTCYGGTLYVVDSYLRANVPGFRYSAGCDVARFPDWWDIYKREFPQTQFQKCRISEFKWAEKVDAVLVDGNHHHRAVNEDYQSASEWARYIAFHDIAGKRLAGTPSAWATVKEQHATYWEFVFWLRRRRWMKGIGVVDVQSKFKAQPIKQRNSGTKLHTAHN